MSADKTDLRIRKTKSSLRKGLFLLLKEGCPVTVKSLTEKSGTGRSSFYLHYKNAEDFIVSIEEEFIQNFSSVLDKYPEDMLSKPEDYLCLLTDTVSLFLSYPEILLILRILSLPRGLFPNSLKSSEFFPERLREIFRIKYFLEWTLVRKNLPPGSFNLSLSFIKGAFLQLLTECVLTDSEYDISTLSEHIYILLSGIF